MGTKFKFRRGQAMIELAIGLFALVLVVSATIGFQEYIVASLEIQRTLRARVGNSALISVGNTEAYVSAKDSDSVQVEPIAAEYIFGQEIIKMEEEIHLPAMGGLNL